MAPPKGVSEYSFRSGRRAKRLRRGIEGAILVDCVDFDRSSSRKVGLGSDTVEFPAFVEKIASCISSSGVERCIEWLATPKIASGVTLVSVRI
jgi:hypothetical protein